MDYHNIRQDNQHQKKTKQERMIAKYSDKEKSLLKSLSVKDLYCIIVDVNPISARIIKKDITTVAIATTPNCSGEISLAKIEVTRRLTKIFTYLDIAVKKTPDINCLPKLISY